jgi:hypothetical protein
MREQRSGAAAHLGCGPHPQQRTPPPHDQLENRTLGKVEHDQSPELAPRVLLPGRVAKVPGGPGAAAARKRSSAEQPASGDEPKAGKEAKAKPGALAREPVTTAPAKGRSSAPVAAAAAAAAPPRPLSAELPLGERLKAAKAEAEAARKRKSAPSRADADQPSFHDEGTSAGRFPAPRGTAPEAVAAKKARPAAAAAPTAARSGGYNSDGEEEWDFNEQAPAPSPAPLAAAKPKPKAKSKTKPREGRAEGAVAAPKATAKNPRQEAAAHEDRSKEEDKKARPSGAKASTAEATKVDAAAAPAAVPRPASGKVPKKAALAEAATAAKQDAPNAEMLLALCDAAAAASDCGAGGGLGGSKASKGKAHSSEGTAAAGAKPSKSKGPEGKASKGKASDSRGAVVNKRKAEGGASGDAAAPAGGAEVDVLSQETTGGSKRARLEAHAGAEAAAGAGAAAASKGRKGNASAGASAGAAGVAAAPVEASALMPASLVAQEEQDYAKLAVGGGCKRRGGANGCCGSPAWHPQSPAPLHADSRSPSEAKGLPACSQFCMAPLNTPQHPTITITHIKPQNPTAPNPESLPHHPTQPQRQYRRLLDMYGSLKSQKIGQLEALVEEQDHSLAAVREVRRGRGRGTAVQSAQGCGGRVVHRGPGGAGRQAPTEPAAGEAGPGPSEAAHHSGAAGDSDVCLAPFRLCRQPLLPSAGSEAQRGLLETRGKAAAPGGGERTGGGDAAAD